LADKGAAGIYRVKTGVGPAGKVRMTSIPAPHIGLGVSHYAWSSSPLRRYVDLVNQRQLLAAVRGQAPAYPKNDAELFAIVSGFDAAYGAYGEFQQLMERYWCLRWLDQNAVRLIRATVLKADLVRLDGLPLVVRVPGLPALPRGRCVELEILGQDLLDLALQARLHRVLEATVEDAQDEIEAMPDPERFAAPVEPIGAPDRVTPDPQDGVKL